MATELGKAYVQIIPSAQGISGSISSILDPEATKAGTSAGLNIGSGIGTALKGAATLVAGATAAVGTAVVKGSSDLAEYGDNIDKMSQKMGISAQGYQEWEAVMQHSGTSMETMKASMKTLANAVEKGNDSFTRIGISVDDLSSMTQEDIFAAVIAGLQNIDNETERTYLAGQLLGRGATELGALLNTSAEDTQAMRDRVRELGGVMSDDAVKSAAAYQDNMQDLQTAIAGLGRGMMSELLPSMNHIISGFTSLVVGEEGAAEALSTGFSSLLESIGGIAEGLVSKITELLPNAINGIVQMLPQLITMATELIVSLAQAIIQALPTLITTVIPALAQAALDIVVALGDALIESGPQLLDAGAQLIDMLVSGFSDEELINKGMAFVQDLLSGITTALPTLLDGGVQMLSSVVNGILESLPQLIAAAGQLISSFAGFILENLPTILEAGVKLLLSVVQGIIENLPELVKAVLEVLLNFTQTIADHLPDILESGISIIFELIAGLIKAIPDLIAAIPEIVEAIFETFAEVNWLEIGTSILEGIAEGIADGAQLIIDAAVEAARRAFNAAKRFLKINSPSKRGIWLGEMLDEGFAIGIEANTDSVADAMTGLSESATQVLQTSPSGNFTFDTNSTSNDKMDLLLSLLTDYLPEIAANKGVNATDLYNGLNRQLGVAIL